MDIEYFGVSFRLMHNKRMQPTLKGGAADACRWVQDMIGDRVQLASYIALTYIFVVLGVTFLHFLNTGEVYTLKYNLLLPSTWVATLASAVVAWGLWHRFRWAWWLGLAAAVSQLVRMSSWLSQQHFSMSKLPGIGVLIVLALVIMFFIVLISPGTRAACAR